MYGAKKQDPNRVTEKPHRVWNHVLYCEQVVTLNEGPKFAGSNPAEAVGLFRAKKILSTPSFGGEVKAVLSHIADLRHVK
jgi:hypothetical protein